MVVLSRIAPYIMLIIVCITFTSLNYYQLTHIKPLPWSLFKYAMLCAPVVVIVNYLTQLAYAMLSAGKSANKLWMSVAVYYIIGVAVSVACTWVFYGKLPSKNVLIGVCVIVVGVVICSIKK